MNKWLQFLYKLRHWGALSVVASGHEIWHNYHEIHFQIFWFWGRCFSNTQTRLLRARWCWGGSCIPTFWGKTHEKEKRKYTKMKLPSPPPRLALDSWDKIERRIREKEKGCKRKAPKPPDLSKLLRLSAKITSAGYLPAPPPPSPLKWWGVYSFLLFF